MAKTVYQTTHVTLTADPILKKQLDVFGRNFFYVREFKKQFDNYWTNADEYYYFAVDSHNFEFKGKPKKVQNLFLLTFLLVLVVFLFLFICLICRKNRNLKKQAKNAKKEALITKEEKKLPKLSRSKFADLV